MKPVIIFVGGQELEGWTEMSLTRSKEELTGSLNISVFFSYMPEKPVMVDAVHGKDVAVYIGGQLAFFGTLDKRKGTGDKHGKDGTTANKENVGSGEGESSRSVNIGPNEYTVQLTARGKTKVLVDSSHQHPTTNILGPTDREVVQKILEPWNINVEWLGEEVKLDKVRLRDGAIVLDELNRIMRENCHFMYEKRDGSLVVTDATRELVGDALLLGTNILRFSAEQSENTAKAKIKVKGQRTKKDLWGKDAILNTEIEFQDEWLQTDIRTVVQHYGDATPEALERRARFEANKRSASSKQVEIDVFHVQPTSGEPWDIGIMHYVEVPPEGIFDMMECVRIVYTVQNNETLKTSLTLSPLPAAGAGTSSTAPTASLPELVDDFVAIGGTRRAAAGVTYAEGMYPQPWTGPVLSVISQSLQVPQVADLFLTTIEATAQTPLMKLPDGYGES